MPELNDETKAAIDAMSLSSMLSKWRFAPVGTFQIDDPWSAYFQESMNKKREANPAAWVRASKDIGW